MVTREQLINGIVKYADAEILPCLPTSGKWVAGTFIVIATAKANELINTVIASPLVNTLGLVDSNGMIDIELLCNGLKQSADRYGKLELDIPMVGKLTFSASDVEKLRAYIIGG